MSLYSRAPLAGLVSNVLDPDKPRRVHGQPEFRRYLQHTSAFRQCVCVCVCVRVCMCAPVCVCVCVLLSTIGLTSGWRRCSKKSKRWSVVLSVVLNSIKGTVAVRLVQQLNFNNLNNVNKQHKQQLKQVKQTTKILTAVGTQRSLTCCRRAGGQP